MNNKAFTFFELLLVIAIIAIIAIMFIPKINNTLKISRIKAFNNEIKIVLSAVSTFCQVQESNEVNDCLINSIIDLQNNNQVKHDFLMRIVNKKKLNYLSVAINTDINHFTTITGYGCVLVSYPAINKNNRYYKKGIRINSLSEKLFNEKDFKEYLSKGNLADITFIYDVNNNLKIDNNMDILMSCSFFKLNDSHNH